MTLPVERGRVFREAWIAGVRKYYPGEPKSGYVTPWEETPEWERESASAVYDQVSAFIEATDGKAAKLTRDQKSRFVALCWIGHIFKHFPDPKPAYVADWDELPTWQQETDADIFERIERETRQ
ncbi:hypothetical protein Lfu02_57440 [Longispora fulva]|uniref:Uncharacterized protein n=1 Tax=Longispora fulva TaxID=619741 RepID=A0A8J7GGR6_9ACTN|nr:hypothetical protein [Longispora fulva]MBG6137275.1 hypothetical protein [Longispora fulva]GIG61372.1 hypothetical protein Lfu02_57440 [Longispora fulva]